MTNSDMACFNALCLSLFFDDICASRINSIDLFDRYSEFRVSSIALKGPGSLGLNEDSDNSFLICLIFIISLNRNFAAISESYSMNMYTFNRKLGTNYFNIPFSYYIRSVIQNFIIGIQR